jgi:membrane protease YdiL (CAAX protease family)
MRKFGMRKGVFLAAFLFAILHLNPLKLNLDNIVDVISILFIGLFCTYLVLKPGSLLPAITFHYLHDIFALLVQNTPGANETLASALLYACLWTALVLGAYSTMYIVERWQKREPLYKISPGEVVIARNPNLVR